MDRGSSEKLSIRDSSKSLRKYGSTNRHFGRPENCIKHFVSESDTLQGISLKYDVTIEQIRRVNRLWASDSLFLKEYLLIPVQDVRQVSVTQPPEVRLSSSISSSSFDDENVEDFLEKIDASIASNKREVKKSQRSSKFAPNFEDNSEVKRAAGSRIKKFVNNNCSNDLYSPPHAVAVQQGKKVVSSLQNHERQQEELFEL